MPPIRSITAKPIKTERTHEENQERAYIAASRRSDRSLEARVESARRASEIHKRRTGRSLRVTEQDVINEEMYEEEDDDLPLQYRRLTAHLNTNSPDFNRRLAAYLTNHVAMRNALDQAISTSYAQQPTPQMWGQPFQQLQPPWMSNQMQNQLPNQMQNQPLMSQSPFQMPTMTQPQMMQRQSPPTFRQTPYPTPAPVTHGYRPNVQRPASIANPQEAQAYMGGQPQQQSPTQPPLFERRASVPVPSLFPQMQTGSQDTSQGLQASQRTASSKSLPSLATSTQSPTKKSSSLPPKTGNEIEPTQQSAPVSAATEHPPPQSWSPTEPMSISPLTATLSPEAQMFFRPSFNPSMFQSFTGGNEKAQQPFYSYNPNSIKQRSVHPSYDGMNQTLAPGALDNLNDSLSWPTPTSATSDSMSEPFTPAFMNGFDSFIGCDGLPQKSMSGDPSPLMVSGSGYATPGEAEWSSFIDTNSWAESTA